MSGRTRDEFRVLLTVEAEDDVVAAYEDRAFDQVGLLHHQIDRFLLRFWERPLFEDRAAGAHEIEEALFVDMALQKLPVRRVLVDVAFRDGYLVRFQKTSGVSARRSRRFPIESGGWHGHILLPWSVRAGIAPRLK
jgi:hypothetical protein